MAKTTFRETQCKDTMILYSATAAGAEPVNSDVAAWPDGASGIIETTDGSIFFAKKKTSSNVRFVELTA